MNNFNQIFNESKKITPGGVHSPVRSFGGLEMPPIFFEKAFEEKLTDLNGKDYIDLCCSFGPLLLGHRDPDVQKEVEGIINKVWSLGACEHYSLELAKWITNEIPWLDKIRFVSSGTEAVMSALRLARGVTNKPYILKFDGCYHGHVDSMLVKSGSGLAGLAESSSAGVSQNVSSETLIAKLDSEEEVKELFEKYAGKIAAVIIEPLPANYGLLKQRPEFLHFLRKITKENDSLLIFDEVISGFRVSLGGMSEKLDIVPDLVTYGKIIGGGFPVGAFAGKSEYMDMMAPTGPVYQAGTLSANPVSMVAGLATLKKIKEVNAIETAEKSCLVFAQKINELFDASNMPYSCIQASSLFFITEKTQSQEIRSSDQLKSNHKSIFNKVYPHILNKNIYLAPAAYEVGFISNKISEDMAKTLAQDIYDGYQKVYNEEK
jgi:glutamate-1-semialdehyde 2,1-aminomutase